MIIVFRVAMAESKKVIVGASGGERLDGPVFDYIRMESAGQETQNPRTIRTIARTDGQNQSAGHPVSYMNLLWLDRNHIPFVGVVCFARIYTDWIRQCCPDLGPWVPRRQAAVEEGLVSFEAVMISGPSGPSLPTSSMAQPCAAKMNSSSRSRQS